MVSIYVVYGDQQMDVVFVEKNILYLLDFNIEVSISLIIYVKIIKFKFIFNFYFLIYLK